MNSAIEVTSIEEGLELIKNNHPLEIYETARKHISTYLSGFGIEVVDKSEGCNDQLMEVLEHKLPTDIQKTVREALNSIEEVLLTSQNKAIAEWGAECVLQLFRSFVMSQHNFK